MAVKWAPSLDDAFSVFTFIRYPAKLHLNWLSKPISLCKITVCELMEARFIYHVMYEKSHAYRDNY